ETVHHGVAIWQLASGREIIRLESVSGPLAFAPDGLSLVARHDRELVLFQVATGQELLRLSGHAYPPHCLAFSPDGSLLASGGGWRDENDGVRVWRAPAPDDAGHGLTGAKHTEGPGRATHMMRLGDPR